MSETKETKQEMNQEVNQEAISQDIISMFDTIISKGELHQDFQIADNLTLTLKVLNTGELLAAEAEATTNHPYFPMDIVNRGRIVSILTRATVAINGVDVTQTNLSKQENEARRNTLYRKIMQLPPEIVEKAHKDYMELQSKQVEALSKPIDELLEDVKSF